MPRTIEEVEALPIVGNAFHDMHIFLACDIIILDPEASMDHRKRALRKMDQTMGEDEKITEQDVLDYVTEVVE